MEGAPSPALLFLDCGAFSGDGQGDLARRSFALVCGRTALLCSFSGTKALFIPQDLGTCPEETQALQKVLLHLAGPMRLDVSLHGREHLPLPCSTPNSPDFTVYLLLPAPRLPLVTPMPDLDPELIPDPSRANCPCHGPVVTRMLYGTPEAPARYRAVGALLSRNPSDWFYLMAESHRLAAADLCKLLDRLVKLGPHFPLHLLVLGHLYELWTGYQCVFQGSGRAAFIKPTILQDVDEKTLLDHWLPRVMNTKNREAVMRLLKIPKDRRTILGAGAFEREGHLLVDGHAAYQSLFREEPPVAFLALREQKAQFRPWRHGEGVNLQVLSLLSGVARAEERGVGMYVTAHGGEPSMMRIGGA